jgi:hypothetical protein
MVTAMLSTVFFIVLSGTASALDYPAEIAAEFPACSGANILQTMNIQGNIVVMMECGGAMEDLYSEYKKIAKKNDWSIMMETQQPEASVLMGQKGEKHLVLNVGSDGGKTIVSITMGKRN